MNAAVTIEKPSRVYRIFKYNERSLWRCEFQPRNPKTGRPWQAARTVLLGNVSHRLSNHNTGAEDIRPGLSPRNSEMWENGKYNSIDQGYVDRADALAAVELYEAQRS